MAINHTLQVFYCLLPITIVCTSIDNPSVIAQSQVQAQSQSHTPLKVSSVVSQNTSQNIVYVNPQTGIDLPDRGSHISPFKTISYANSVSRSEKPTIIQLANGSFSIATGEQFPIRLRSNVTIRGNEATKGKGIVIIGGGTLLTGSRFTQNVVISLSERSELRGVTVTNPNSRGYGIWIENVSPVISNNTFLDNHQDGALITGKSTAIVSANQFFRNGTSGLAVEGDASPDVRGNLFQQTTFGMSIRQDATPQITENTFTQNQNGILIQANAKPVLRGNVIVNNRSYGLTISDSARPDLGKANDSGNNTLQGNGVFDLQNVSRNSVDVIGNQLDIKKAKGNLQFLDVRSPSNQFSNTASINAVSPDRLSSSNILPSGLDLSTSLRNDRLTNANPQLEQKFAKGQAMNFTPNLSPPNALIESTTSNQNDQLSSNFNRGSQANIPFWYEPVTSVIVRITPKRLDSSVPINSEITSSLSPVRAFPPSGEPVNQPIQIAPLSNVSMTPQTPARYRVVVPVSSTNAVAQVRQIVPNSFASRLNGDLVVQIGAYSDRSIAEVQVSRLAKLGLSARIESIRR